MIKALFRKFLRGTLKRIYIIRENLAPTVYLDPKKLLTSNRKDFYYGQQFLKDVLEHKKKPEETFYYYFASDKDAEWVYKYGNKEVVTLLRDKNTEHKDFIELCNNIKKNGITEPLVVRKYKSKFIKVVYMLKGKKYWRSIENETGYQLVHGNHRLSIALYLGYEKIPVKIFSPWFSTSPDHTSHIMIKEKEWLEKIDSNL